MNPATFKERPADKLVSKAALGDVVQVIKSGPNVMRCVADFFKTYECPLEEATLNSLREAVDDPTLDEVDRNKATEELKRYKFGNKKYLNRLQDISDGYCTYLEVNIGDVNDWVNAALNDPNSVEDISNKLAEVQDCLTNHTERGVRLTTIAAEDVRREHCPSTESSPGISISRAALLETSVSIWHRAPFEVSFSPADSHPLQGVRDIRDYNFGRLMRIEVLISKVNSARPIMKVAKYVCTTCQADVYQPVEEDDYVPSRTCVSESCKNTSNPGDLVLVPKESRMLPHETVTVQEPSNQCPQGCVPRRMEVVLEGHLANTVQPGMQCTLTGVPYPQEKRGFAAIAGGLVRDVGFKVLHLVVHKQSDNFNAQQRLQLDTRLGGLRSRPDFYNFLAHSICPSIYGMMDVKKALLLQLIGAPNLRTDAGLNVRGEVHILLMGDPGVAKSQLLGKIVKVAPRAQYTTGKGASGVGLTASVMKDPVTGEFSLEGGSIVLADNGVCCIDEFDKMDENDRTAIHEVMEQQTVSVSKAGLNVQLNARTAILAAANPVFGRYDLTKSAVDNMKLPYSLISRFDLQFLLLDTVDADQDRALSLHILNVHRGVSHSAEEYLTPTELRYFVLQAQQYQPTIPPDVAVEIREKYVDIRAAERLHRQMAGKENTYTTPRALFSIIRLAQAHARIRMSNEVTMEDVSEAIRLMDASKASIQTASSSAEGINTQNDYQSAIIDAMRRMDSSKANNEDTEYDGYLEIGDIESTLAPNGYSRKQIDETISSYVALGVLQLRNNRNRDVGFVDRLET